MARRHECRYFRGGRNLRRCTYCGQLQYLVHGKWVRSMTLRQFADKWLPAISGTDPKKMLTVEVAFPFEFNCYESWNVAFRVRFDFTDVLGRRDAGLGTRVDAINGWRSGWAEDFAYIDYDLERYYEERTGQPYRIGDNAYDAMRRIIQS